MNNIICIANPKAGVGATTTAVNLAATLAIYEKQTLLIDCDPQGKATKHVGLEKDMFAHSLYDALIDGIPAKETIAKTSLEYLNMMSARSELFETKQKLAFKSDEEIAFRSLLENFTDDYEYVIIDSGQSSAILRDCAIIASDWLLIPLKSEHHAIEKLLNLLKDVREIRKNHNTNLKILGLLLTMCEDTADIYRKFPENTLKSFENIILSTTIPYDKNLCDSYNLGKPIALHDIVSKGAKAYIDLGSEIINIIKSGK